MKILPYIRQDKRVDGVVITFIDISNIKELNNIVTAVFNSSISAIMALKAERNNKEEITDFNWIAANYATDELLNQPAETYIGKSLKKQFPELVKENLFQKFVSVVDTGIPIQTEVSLTIAGINHWFDLIVTKMMNGVVISLTNIDDKEKAEEKFRSNYYELMNVKESYRNLNIELEDKVKERTFELTRSEERFRLIANITYDAIWDWDLVNNRIWWSESFYSRFGFEKLEHKLTSTFWISHIHPDDRERVSNSIYSAINNGTSNWSEQFRFQKKDGSY